MTIKRKIIAVHTDDVKNMREVCKELFLKSHPEFKRHNFTDAELFNLLVEYYIRTG